MVREFQKKNDLAHLKAILKDSLTTALTQKVFEEDYEALVLTKANQSIVWVSDGFKDMTGYSKTFAIGKRPKFLQGEETSSATRKQLREGLAKNHVLVALWLIIVKMERPIYAILKLFYCTITKTSSLTFWPLKGVARVGLTTSWLIKASSFFIHLK